MIKGRAPVSTDGQTIDAQHSALGKAESDPVFAEKQSRAKTGLRWAMLGCARAWEYPPTHEA
jgi:hypothetical protein